MHAYDIYASSEAKKKEEVAHRFPPRELAEKTSAQFTYLRRLPRPTKRSARAHTPTRWQK